MRSTVCTLEGGVDWLLCLNIDFHQKESYFIIFGAIGSAKARISTVQGLYTIPLVGW
jgi:hypothetical protein